MDGQTHPPIGKVTKTPTHTLTRVRNNQRRHRQRRREYIASLEQRLKDTEERLAQVRAENASLRNENMSTSSLSQDTHVPASLTIPETNMTTQILSTATSASREIQHYPLDARVTELGSATVEVLQPDFPSQEVGSESYEGTMIDDIPPFLLYPNSPVSVNTELTLPTTYLISPSAAKPRPACCSRTSPEPSLFNKDTSWLSNQASIYGASMFLSTSTTTLCSQAYLTIQHHNRRQLPMEVVERWLWPGFIISGPSAEHGCRVDNQLLLGLLEYITEWESPNS
jgi:hypothetical protein